MASQKSLNIIVDKIPGEVIKAVDEFVAARDERMELSVEEHGAKERLIAVCKKHDLTVPFVLNNRKVSPITKDDISVRKIEKDED